MVVAVEKIIALHLNHGFISRKGVAQGGVNNSDGLDVIASLDSLRLSEGRDFQFDIRLFTYREGVSPVPDSRPLLIIEGSVKIVLPYRVLAEGLASGYCPTIRLL